MVKRKGGKWGKRGDMERSEEGGGEKGGRRTEYNVSAQA